MGKNQLIINAPHQKVTMLKSEIIDLFNQLEDLDIETITDLTVELEDMIEDVVKTYENKNLAMGLKKRILMMRILINFFKTVEVTK